MENRIKAIKMLMSVKGYAWVTVSGFSMYPVLHDGEKVKVVSDSQYKMGDILVYEYKTEGLLVHRLIKIENDRYLCKGDNSFRLENVAIQQIIGKVNIMDDVNNNITFIKNSLKIGVLFKENQYNREMTK